MAKKKVGFKHHPETGEGEIFLTNVLIGDEGVFEESGMAWKDIDLRTKRMGSVAYDIYGEPISGMRPVFVKRDELLRKGVNPDTLWEK